MALVQMQPHFSGLVPTPVVVDLGNASGLRVRGDMTVEVALSVMAGARVGYLLVCDEDDQCTGSVTEAQLAVVRDGSAYTDRVRVRDVLGARRTPGVLALSH
ncbi:CBS domain-containing protein [Streptomyces sp. NPDC054766]|uniref:CBS domain-containing protein n=1 Tax=Streptomyces rhizosphaerihabitans TaxID=1266770 RepID=UPI0028F6D704|nr:CBS domain-containing protein [Streptomyces rhizosphaerihabitans]